MAKTTSQLLARLLARHRRRSASTLGLSLLAAGTEGMGLLLLIPLLALAGVSSGERAGALGAELVERFDVELELHAALGAFLLVIAIRQLVVYGERLNSMRIRLDFGHGLRADLFQALASAEWRYFSAGAAHRLVQILTLESRRAGNAVQQCFTLATIGIVMAVHVAIAAALSLTYTAIAVAGILLLLPAIRARLAHARKLGATLVAANERLYALTSNLLPMLRTAKMAGTQQRLTARFLDEAAAYNRAMERHTIVSSATTAGLQLAVAALVATSIVVGVQWLALDAVSLLVLVVIFARLTPLLAQAQQIGQHISQELAAVDTTLEAIARWRERAEPVLRSGPAYPRRSIALAGISAGYADEHEATILHDLSLSMPVGQTTLVSGPTGAGKSTLADVAAGLLRPLAGALELDGRPLSAAERLAWRTRVGYVEQTAALVTGSVRENLSSGHDEIDAEWLARVAHATLLDDVLAGKPGGLEASVGEGGAALSGGERQRVAIARELLRQPALLVLDEATSGLDETTETTLLERLKALDPKLTVLLISHRPGAAKHADQAIELERGGIVRSHPAAARPVGTASGAPA